MNIGTGTDTAILIVSVISYQLNTFKITNNHKCTRAIYECCRNCQADWF